MTARDALNYYFEAPSRRAAVVLGFAFDGAASPAPGHHTPVTDHDSAVAFARTVVHLHPMFRRRLRTVRWDLAFPQWVECDVDLSRHVVVHTAPVLGAADFVKAKIVELNNAETDFGRPPWKFHFVFDVRGMEGVPEGGTVMVFHFHHSAIDGLGLADVVNAILTDPVPLTGVQPGVAVRFPTLGDAARRIPSGLASFTRVLVQRAAATRRLRRSLAPDVAAGWTLEQRPAVRFNNTVPVDNVMDLTWFDLDRVRAIKSSFDTMTVNDVMMTVISMALSDYLAEAGELPPDSLSTSIPMSTRSFTASGDTANNLTAVVLSLHTDIADPVDRLIAIHASAALAKARGKTMATELPANPLVVAPSILLKIGSTLMRTPPATPTTVKINTMISTVPYGSAPLGLGGAPATSAFGVMPTVDGIGLTHAFATYRNKMSLAVMTHAESMPDTGHYMSLLQSAMTKLESAALSATPLATA